MAEPHPNVNRRNPQGQDSPTLPPSIPSPTSAGATVSTTSGLIASATPYATAIELSTGTDERGNTVTITSTTSFYNAADYANYMATHQTSSSAIVATSTNMGDPAATSSTNSNPSSNKSSSVPIAAIVAPVVAVLLLGFGLFWWIMRRRAQKATPKESDFVMEKRSRSRKHSRDDSTHSESSTRKLVPKRPVDEPKFGAKEPMLDIKELPRTSLDIFNDKREPSDGLGIGIASSPSQSPSHSRQHSTESNNPSGPPTQAPVTVRNFSRGPSRPSTAQENRDHPALSNTRDRSVSNPGSRPGPPAYMMNRSDPRDRQYGNQPYPPNGRPDPRGPAPNMRGPPPHASNGSHGNVPRGAPRAPPGAMVADRQRNEPPRTRVANRPPPAIQTQGNATLQKPSVLSPPTPTGAYNGASPISQYSPIIKEHPNKLEPSPPLGPSAGGNLPGYTDSSPLTPEDAYSRENMEIARLADSSRLGFYKDTNNKSLPPAISTSTKEHRTIEPPAHSPQLPPPATRDAPPMNFPPPPPPPADPPAVPSSNSRRADSFVNDRRSMRSMISRLSDDEYVDMEVDAKSDVSSLDERERWDMENETRSTAGSRAATSSGLGTYGGRGTGSGARPPLLSSPGMNSTATGSQYSLNKY